MADDLPRTAALIVNAQSRKGQEMFDRACRLLQRRGLTLASATAVKDPARLAGTVRDAVAAGAPMVIVGGGDGTISSAVDHLVGSDSIFALLPLGTANSFARTLDIPLDLEGAVEVIAGGRARRIDLGMIDGDYFANCASIGLAPLIAQSVPQSLKKWLGRPGYVAWAALQMLRFRPFRLAVEGGQGRETIEALEVRIANGAYHGGTELVEADVTSGEIVIQVVVGGARAKLLWSWGLSLIGPEQARGTLREFRGRRFRIATDPPLPISIDGEVLARTPIDASVATAAIRMAVPLAKPQPA